MQTWLLLISASILQELALYTTAFLTALDKHWGFDLIFLIFAAATAADIWIGFQFGKWFQKKFQYYRLGKFLNHKAKDVDRLISARGKGYILTLLGIVNFPYFNAFLSSWLDISFERIFLYTFLGDLISFSFIWSVLLGLDTLNLDVYISIVISILLISIMIYFLKKVLKL